MKKKVDYLTRWELAKLLRKARSSDFELYTILLVSYLHGLRASEVLDLRKSDIDLKGERITCRRLKGSTTNCQPLTPEEITTLGRAIGKVTTGKLFRISRQHLDRKIKDLFKKCGLDKDRAHHHILKHTLAVHLLERGNDIYTIKNILGHKEIKNTLIYLSVRNTKLDKIQVDLYEHIGGLL